MRVLLTGATGFIGSHLARLMLSEGHSVYAVIRPASDLWRIRDISAELVMIRSDLTDLDYLRKKLETIQPSLCVHLAWRGWSGTSFSAEDNISSLSMSLELICLVSQLGCPRLVMAGTCFEYDTEYGYLSEETPAKPHDLYGASKYALFLVAQQFAKLRGTKIAWPRIFYSYGPFEDSRRLVPSIVIALLRNQVARVTRGEQIKDYLYVEDVASAIWAIAQSDVTGAINVGSGSPVTVAELAMEIGRLLRGQELIQLGALPYRVGDPMCLRANTTLLRDVVGWTPRFDLREGLSHTIEWWRGHQHDV